MRFFHTSDTHLGHQQYHALSPNGLNQREEDIYASWHHIIDLAVSEKPDAFIHAGDLFDGVRPGNRALHQAMQGFLKLSRAGIPTFVIAGNHEHPKMRETGSPFRLFEHLDNVHVIYQGKREVFDVAGYRIHAVPQCADNETLGAEIAGAELKGKDILVVHGAIHSLKAFTHAEFNELSLEPAWFKPFTYVALGHFHGTQQVAPNAWYCGAPERVSMGEAGQAKGFLDVHGGHATFRAIPTRKYMDLGRVDATGLEAASLHAACLRILERLEAGVVARLTIENMDPSLRGAWDARSIQAAAKHALHFELRTEWTDAVRVAEGAAEFGNLTDEFGTFLSKQSLSGVDRQTVLDMAKRVLEGA